MKLRRYKKKFRCYWCERLVWIGAPIVLLGPAKQRERECRECRVINEAGGGDAKV